MTTWKLSQPDETTEVLLDGLCEHKGHGNLCLDLHGHTAQSGGLITPTASPLRPQPAQGCYSRSQPLVRARRLRFR